MTGGKKLKVLQLCHKMPFPPHDGGSVSQSGTALGLLSAGIDVRVLAMDPAACPTDSGSVPQWFREKTRFVSVPVDTCVTISGALSNLFSTHSYFSERFHSREFDRALVRILSEEDFDIVHLEHVYLCLYLGTIRKHSAAKTVLRPQNVESNIWLEFLKGVRDPLKRGWLRVASKRLLKYEQAMSAQVDGILAISPGDAEAFRKFAPGIPLQTVPPGFNPEIVTKNDPERQYDHFPVFYHLGSMDWRPNLQGIDWFINEVLPFVSGKYPDFCFRIAGKKMPRRLYACQNRNLVVDGEVRDSQEYQEDKAVMIVPLLSGSGIRIKIIEAMAMGKTVISTTVGAEGIPYTNGENILIADAGERFAEQIGRCMRSEEFCRKIGNKARELAFSHYDRAVNAERMIGFYKMLINKTGNI
jgi:glycosyltransferase involved in cell wall biosynthesis